MSDLVLNISQLTDIIKSYLEDQVGTVVVEGEISNFKPHYSGHRYFTLKDSKAQISCVMWKSRPLNFTPSDGMNVKAKGTLSVYPARGSYQLDIIYLSPLGIGDLYLAFEKMRAKLQEQGYFAQEHKKTIPKLPLKIGVSTSPTGAAVKDIFSTIQRRFPKAEILFRPTIVQGNEASADICKAIEELNQVDADVLIVGRGGGSIEDLWAYNTEEVATAIFNSKKPIISAVGHETDFTIADFVADLRAATPTAAAEIVTPVLQQDAINFVNNSILRMEKGIRRELSQKNQQLDDTWKLGIKRKIDEKLKYLQNNLNRDKKLLISSVYRIVENHKKNLGYWDTILQKSNPSLPLEKGYAILKHKDHIISVNEKLSQYSSIEVLRKNEEVVVKIVKDKQNKSSGNTNATHNSSNIDDTNLSLF